MSFPVIEQYKQKYPEHANLLDEFESYFNRKYFPLLFRLWHELSKGVLIFIFQKNVQGKISFDFYTSFIKKFDRNIDQITHLKILKECLANVERILDITQPSRQSGSLKNTRKRMPSPTRPRTSSPP